MIDEEEMIIKTLDKLINKNIIKPYKESDKIIDMHVHSCYSDGVLTPNELIRLAIDKRISTLSITDHDTIEGIKKVDRTDKLIQDTGIEIINGIELSAKRETGRMHILGYGIDLENKDLNKKMSELRDISINSVLTILEQIKKDYNIRFNYDDIKDLVNSTHHINRVDIARLCVKNGYATSVKDAFNRYLIDAYDKTRTTRTGIYYEECLDLIKRSGGIPVLAHPKTLELSEKELLKTIRDMMSCGLEGIEVYHSSHSLEQMKLYRRVAEEYNLLISGGSDFHGKGVKPDIEMGSGKNNNLNIKTLSLVDRLHNR